MSATVSYALSRNTGRTLRQLATREMAFATLGYEKMSNIGLSEGGMALLPEKARTKGIDAGASHR